MARAPCVPAPSLGIAAVLHPGVPTPKDPSLPWQATMQYQVMIQMSAASADALMSSGAALLGFAAVQCSDSAGLPLVWLRTTQYAPNTVVAWSDAQQAFTGSGSVSVGNVVVAGFAADIAPGQLLTISDPTGTGTVGDGGTAGNIDVENTTTTPLLTGLAQPVSAGSAAPYCGFPLHGGGLQVMAPLPTVLLTFSTMPVQPGTAVSTVHSSGILIAMGGTAQRTVNFDIDAGWSWGGGAWAQAVGPTASLAPLLIEYNPQLAALAKAKSLP